MLNSAIKFFDAARIALITVAFVCLSLETCRPSMASDGGYFKGKTFLATFEAAGTQSTMRASLKIYVGMQNEVFAYDYSTGTSCGAVGGVSRVGSSRTSYFSCNGSRTKFTLSSRISGGVLTLNEALEHNSASDGVIRTTRRVSLSYNGSSCQALGYYFSFKSRNTQAGGLAFPLTPISCQVTVGRT